MNYSRYSNPSPLKYGLPLPRRGDIYTVVKDAGTHYLVRASTSWNEPKVGYAWFTLWNADCDINMFVGKQLEATGNYGSIYEYKLGFAESLGGRRCTVRIRGDVEPIKVEFADAPPPKARGKQIRWHEGGWQKLLKRGWVDV